MLWHKGHVVKGQGHGGSERSQDKDYWLSTHREGSDAQRLGRVRSLRLVPWVAYDVAAHEFADFFHRFSFHRLVPVVFGGVTRFEQCHGVIPRSAPSAPSLSDEHAKCDGLAARWNSCAALSQPPIPCLAGSPLRRWSFRFARKRTSSQTPQDAVELAAALPRSMTLSRARALKPLR